MNHDELEKRLEALERAWREHIAIAERIQAISTREAIRALVELGLLPAKEKP